MKRLYNRRKFIKNSVISSLSIGVLSNTNSLYGREEDKRTKIGVIGLDTSHSVVFTRMINDPKSTVEFADFKVVAAYPHGSNDIESSLKVIPANIQSMEKMGVEIVSSIQELIEKVDVVLLETNDGRLHLQQALSVIKSKKRLFIDKPITASLKDTIKIFDAAKHYNVPVFSSSSLRFMDSAQQIVNGKIGKVIGADVYSPAIIEKTHPDLFWYGIHGIETLFTIMGPGCKSLTRTYTEDTDIVVGIWDEKRLGTFRGIRKGKNGYGGTAFGDKGIASIGPFEGYKPLLLKILEFFRTGDSPVNQQETIEIITFMEAAEISKKKNGASVNLEDVFKRANKTK